MAGSRVHGGELSFSVKGKELLHKLSELFLKKDSSLCGCMKTADRKRAWF
jgi:hypothetical protein